MKTYTFLFVALGILILPCHLQSQTQKQYFENCPEIDLGKKLVKAYLDQDWETYRSCYSDTARIWQNAWYSSDPGNSIDQEMSATKEFVSNLANYTYEETIWEMIINNNGDKWVHFWGKWVGKLSPDSEVLVVPVHLAFGVVADKVVYEAGFWDNLPMYMAQKKMEKEE